MDLTVWQWSIAGLGALLVGLGKGGLPGVGNLTVILFAMIFEPKASVGLLLPVLISADLVAITVYRRHVEWKYLWRLLPWMTVGILIGYATFDAMDKVTLQRLIGGIVLAMTALQVVRTLLREYKGKSFGEAIPHRWPFQAGLGLTGGFATMVANAAGPVGQLYFISVGLPKLAFIGTGAWCFFIVNVMKVPLQWDLGIIHGGSLLISLSLAPLAMLGAGIAPFLVKYISQRWFEWAVWTFIFIAGCKLMLAS